MFSSTRILAATALSTIVLALPNPGVRGMNYDLVSDVAEINQYWGQLAQYKDLAANEFGVKNVGLPDGCAVEQAHVLHRHGAREATGAGEDGANNAAFAAKVAAAIANGTTTSGPLAFLANYTYSLSSSGLLLSEGRAELATSGADFWKTYGRLLYDAVPGQTGYNSSFVNGTSRPLPVLRTTSESRILQSAQMWAEGFFGFNSSSLYDLIVIDEDNLGSNNTLAPYVGCTNGDTELVGYLGDNSVFAWTDIYLQSATERLSAYFDSSFQLTTNDTYAEYSALGSSDFCSLFTLDEWKGFEHSIDIVYYYDGAWPNPIARASGLGYLEELLARLDKTYIKTSDSTVNSTLDSSPSTFPLDQAFYLDMTHDTTIINLFTAMNLEYFQEDVPLKALSAKGHHYIESKIAPFGGKLITEVIGCTSSAPAERRNASTVYSKTANGYTQSSASHKFIRMRLNNGILPLDTIAGGFCNGRSDGLCDVKDFMASQVNASALANFDYSCFADTATVLADANGNGAASA
ncbi:hypothetical protein P7C73_g1071, partial [Tremellales sp. Uapishka_1]